MERRATGAVSMSDPPTAVHSEGAAHLQERGSSSPSEQGDDETLIRLAGEPAKHLPNGVFLPTNALRIPNYEWELLSLWAPWTGYTFLDTASALPADLHPATSDELSRTPFASMAELHGVTHLRIYTDGSDCLKNADGDPFPSAWALVILFGYENGSYKIAGATGGRVLIADDTWRSHNHVTHCFGYREHSPAAAEYHGLVWALLWLLQSPTALPCELFCDADCQLHNADGSMGYRPEPVPNLLRCLAVLAGQRRHLKFQEIAGHSGNPWNELADVLAKGFSAGSIFLPAPPGGLPTRLLYDRGLLDWIWLGGISEMDRPAYPPGDGWLHGGGVATGDVGAARALP